MKKLRMIVTSVMVLTIVSSALAFTTKRVGTYCKSTTDQQNLNCAIVNGLYNPLTGDNNTYYKQNWNGQSTTCTSTDCGTAVRLLEDN